MPLLTPSEALDVSDSFLQSLYGEEIFVRWKELKAEMQFITERAYVRWLIDVASQYRKEEVSAMSENQTSEIDNEDNHLYQSVKYIRDTVKKEDISNFDCYQRNLGEGSVVRRSSNYEMRVKASTSNTGQYTISEQSAQFSASHSPLFPSIRKRKLLNTTSASARKLTRYPDESSVDINYVDPAADVGEPCKDDGTDNMMSIENYSAEMKLEATPQESDDILLADGDDDNDDMAANSFYDEQSAIDATGGGGYDPSEDTVAVVVSAQPSASAAPRNGSVIDAATGRARCQHCNYESGVKMNVRRHLVLKHGYASNHQCRQCLKYFYSGDTLRRHADSCSMRKEQLGEEY